jgi:hypothetical protein
MLQRPEHHDKTAFDAMLRANHHSMRFFAPLRMTAYEPAIGGEVLPDV